MKKQGYFGTRDFTVFHDFTDVFKIYGRQVLRSEQASRRVGRQEGVNNDNVDITTGVTTWSPRSVDGEHAGYDGIRPATQVGRMGVERCLRDHDDGVSRVDEGVVNTSIRLRKQR